VSLPGRVRAIVLLLIATLAALLLLWRRESLAAGSLLELLWLAPLLPALPGIVRGKRYTYAWSTLLVTGYVALALTEIVANAPQRGVATLMLLVAFALFIALVAYLRVTRSPGSAG
jgi:uncharacterized membrane protein